VLFSFSENKFQCHTAPWNIMMSFSSEMNPTEEELLTACRVRTNRQR
jgi:hypothetical protein